MLTPAQGCFRVPAASAEAVVLTLSGLTANVALQVTLLFCSRLACLTQQCSAEAGVYPGFALPVLQQYIWWSVQPSQGEFTQKRITCRQQLGRCRRGRRCW